jgi:hypothetical protein
LQIICKGYERLIFPELQANMRTSLVVCPKSKNDVDDFISQVLGIGGSELDAADIVIMDQNIELTGKVCKHALCSKFSFNFIVILRFSMSRRDP